MDCIMVHQMIEARLGKNRSESLKYAASVVEGRSNNTQRQQKQQQQEIEGWLAVLRENEEGDLPRW